MSTGEVVARYERLPLEMLRRSAFEAGNDIRVQKSVNADRSRLFQALTVAEYIDAWFVAPSAVPGSTSVTIGPNCFVVTYRSFNGREERFVGSYKVLRRGKVQFAWKRDSFDDTTWSLVKIRLLGDFGRTTVQLTHVGLDPSERTTYRAQWEASLEKLARLF